MPSLAGAGRGAAMGAGIGSFIPGVGTAIGAGIGGLFGLFGGGRDDKKKADAAALDPYQQMLQDAATRLQGTAGQFQQQGQALGDMGAGNLADASTYLRQLLGVDPQGIMAATAPERGRVIDQYDTARRAIGEFGPRGGGTTSALAQSRLDEASALSDIMSTARRDAFGQAADLGTTLTGLGLSAEQLGLSAEQLASGNLDSIINSILAREGLDITKRGQNMQAWGGVGETLGGLLGLYLTRQGGPWQRAGA